MIYIITAPKNRGKTTYLKSLFQKEEGGQGFCSEKIMKNGVLQGYALRDLYRNDTKIIALVNKRPLPPGWGESFSYGPFHFSKEAFKWAMNLCQRAIKEGASSFFIDELGPVEIQGKGHHALITQAAASPMNLYITLRSNLINAACQTFAFKDYKIIQPPLKRCPPSYF